MRNLPLAENLQADGRPLLSWIELELYDCGLTSRDLG